MELEPPLFAQAVGQRVLACPGMTEMAMTEGETRGLLGAGEMEDCQTELTELCFHHLSEFHCLLGSAHFPPYSGCPTSSIRQ